VLSTTSTQGTSQRCRLCGLPRQAQELDGKASAVFRRPHAAETILLVSYAGAEIVRRASLARMRALVTSAATEGVTNSGNITNHSRAPSATVLKIGCRNGR
jgi:hypothetical protein